MKRQVLGNDRKIWLKHLRNNDKKATVNYYFDKKTSYAARQAFFRAAKAWEKDTCINFTMNEKATDVIHVVGWGKLCLSNVGKVGGRQNMSLGEGCEWFGHAYHEIGHALGLHHAQNRWDRDEHITINWANIPKDYVDQFNSTASHEFTTYGFPYDYGSVMHYESNRTKPMMTPKKDHYMGTIGSPMISFIDLSMINEHYYCKTKCVNSGTRCENGGFPHPRDCSECICPGGYGGRLCNERVLVKCKKSCLKLKRKVFQPNDLGDVRNATSNWTDLFMTHYNPSKDLDYLKRTYWIKVCGATDVVAFAS
ncbi:astacin [Ancylostoma caninum]|uniref:Metalloendopeptidase n=1 Tax=Ancylostoma caninum TaxID=29170 RepID=A0A368FIZ8_ANCCA|nr:astacin [Ancylostoma caninum]